MKVGIISKKNNSCLRRPFVAVGKLTKGLTFIRNTDYTSPLYTKGNLAATAYRTKTSDNWNYKYYKYDVRGRVIKMWNIIADFDTLTTEYIYNSQDQITFLYYQAGKSDSKSYYYEYDYTGRLKNTSYYTGPPSDNPIDYTNLASYDYNKNSQVSNQNFNGNTLENTYSYNSRNWITHLESSNNIFNYANTYFKNGNVKTQNISGDYHKPFSNQVDLNYTNTYDKSNRLLSSITPAKKFNLTNTYDKDGNILTMERTGSSGNVMDNFIYSYYSGTNKVSKVKGSANQYAYDANGNMITDSLNKNTNIKYDYRNLITQIQHKAIVNTDTSFYLTYYSYDEAGNRFAKTIYKYTSSSGPPEDSNPGGPVTDDYWDLYSVEIYSRDISGKELAIYKDNVILEYPLYGLDMIGKIKNDELFFYYKDHLGSVRATVNSSGDVVSSQDYDAWGYILQDRTYDSEDSKFKFTSKERDSESDYDYFGARYYDSRIGRWGSVDPLTDNELGKTPYHYTSDNPINKIDPEGLDDFYYSEGKQVDYRERSWIHNLFFGDSYFVQSNQGDVEHKGANYFQALSKETIEGNWLYVDENWTAEGFQERVKAAVGNRSNDEFENLEYVKEQSNEGSLDQKWNLKPGGSEEAQKYIYIYNNIALNWREAGNAIWGASIRKLGFGYGIARLGEEINHFRKYTEFDQSNEVNAVKVGYFNASYKNSKLWSKEW